MAAELLLLLLVCAGGLLLPAEAQDSYDQLPTVDKAGVDLALEQLLTNSGVKHHFRFLKSVEKNERDVSLSFSNLHFPNLVKSLSPGTLVLKSRQG